MRLKTATPGTASGVRSLKYIITPEGRAVKSGTTWNYEYNLKDHLGNVRAVIRDSSGVAQVIQERHYYPFGMEMSELSSGTSANKYLYNGKEYQTAFGLDWYDYGARFYDPGLGRWHQQDPVLEEYYSWSPYTYVLNNPVVMNDPTGMVANANTDGLEVIGKEKAGEDYRKGGYIRFNHNGADHDVYASRLEYLYNNEGIKQDYTIESLVIPVFGFLRYIKVGKYLCKLVPTKTGKYILKFVGLADDIPTNRLTHIFGNSEHALDDLVRQFGSETKAYNAVQRAANKALKEGKIHPNAKGILPSGDDGFIINVEGTNVRLIGGRVTGDAVDLSSFSRKGL